jgi:hypothetical protein
MSSCLLAVVLALSAAEPADPQLAKLLAEKASPGSIARLDRYAFDLGTVALRFGRIGILIGLVVVGAVLPLSACGVFTKHSAVTEERVQLSAAEVVLLRPDESVVEVLPERMLDVVRTMHIVRPDIRFLGAIAEAQRIIQGKPRGKLRVAYGDRRWLISLEGKDVGSLSDTASCLEALDLLRTWSREVLSSSRELLGPVVENSETLRRRAAAEDPFSQQAITNLEQLETSWSKGVRTPEKLDLAGRETITLCLQSLDRMGVADQLYAKTLALLSLREAAQGRRFIDEEALLASLMGYRTDAERLAEPLPDPSWARLWTGRDTKRFQAEAELSGSSQRLRYLFLLRLAERAQIGEWATWLSKYCPDLRGGIPLARAALELNDFGPDRESAQLMLDVLFVQMTDESRAAALWSALLYSVEQQPATRDLILILRRFIPANPGPPPSVLSQFESALAARVRGASLMDSDTERAYYRCLFYSALYTLGIYELDRRGSAPDALVFAESLKNGPPGPAADFARWYGDLARTMNDTRAISGLIEDLDGLDSLGQAAIERVGDEVLRILPANDPRNAPAALKYGRRLDARPPSRLAFGVLCLNEYLDLPCYERYYGSAAREWGRQWYATFPGLLRRTGGRDAMIAMVEDTSVKASARVLALQVLEKDRGADAIDLTTQVVGIARDNPHDVEVVDYAYRFLRDKGRLKEAEQLERRELAAHPDAPDLQKAQRASRLAEVLVLQGRNDEAWEAIEPWLFTGKSDVYYAGSLALEARGKHTEALKMARGRLDRYPDEPYARAEMAELLWRQNRGQEVPALFQDPRHIPAPFDWKNAIGPAFRDAFARRSVADMEAAFAPLVSAGFNPWYLAEIASVVERAGRPDAAFALLASITAKQPGVGAIDPRFDAYRYMKAWKGQGAAVEWVRAALTPATRFKALEATLDEGLLDLFWQIDDPPPGAHGADNVNLLRATAFALAPAKAEGRREALEAYFQGRKGSPQAEYALFLLGVTPQPEFLRIAVDPARRGPIAYYIGLRSIGAKQYEDASDWLLIALRTAIPNTKESQSAKSILYRWARDGSSFERMKEEPLF